ncbi:aldehyde dehydrogenase family protein [Stenotrophomonas sp. CD2]|nr:aldehyde dehydrogenase family protein [Stenotrophomonas sp. CD2]
MAAVLRRDREKLAALATAEMGKVQAESLAEIEKCAVLCDWYADNGAQFLRDEPTQCPMTRLTCPTCRWAWCWASCRGTSPTGR